MRYKKELLDDIAQILDNYSYDLSHERDNDLIKELETRGYSIEDDESNSFDLDNYSSIELINELELRGENTIGDDIFSLYRDYITLNSEDFTESLLQLFRNYNLSI